MKNIDSRDFVSFAGRLLLSGIFLAAGISKFRQAEQTEQYMASKNLPNAPALRPIAASVELLSALSLITGIKPRVGAATGLLFLVPTTLLFHAFWNESEQKKQEQTIHFLKNLAIMGGLAQVIAAGPGRIALEHGAAERDAEFRELWRAA